MNETQPSISPEEADIAQKIAELPVVINSPEDVRKLFAISQKEFVRRYPKDGFGWTQPRNPRVAEADDEPYHRFQAILECWDSIKKEEAKKKDVE